MKKVVIVTIVMVILIVNIDLVLMVDDYFKAIMLFVLAGILSIYEYKREKKMAR
ncbi:hypothetical protein [Jejuia spongiicola]|uniref:Uncharacterized protein n=1 Tax=Jejuia spongiicola TaxID=2942207 RepID=A0ABT0QB18_9FLAO|nr:hypothetical protein [Jejuia spongiicola]MCL6294172.1 hypothetical protein [Jejuia spongiicola]